MFRDRDFFSCWFIVGAIATDTIHLTLQFSVSSFARMVSDLDNAKRALVAVRSSVQYANTQTDVVNVILVVACRPVLLLRSPSELVVDEGVVLLIFFWARSPISANHPVFVKKHVS